MDKNRAIYFIILLGLVSLFSDMTYEAARSISGPYLSFLGASAVAVGFAGGFGEFAGYSLRFLSGWLADKIKTYWAFIISGYALSLFAVPALALVHSWKLAVILLVLERLGKALRTPARDTLLSYATFRIGRGLGFGIHEALDQVGAVGGPLLIALVFYLKGGYREAFSVLLIPALIALSLLIVARKLFPMPQDFELSPKRIYVLESKGFPRSYFLYLIAMGFFGAGFIDFILIGFHLERAGLIPREHIPLLYALAMGIDALFALILGYLLDRIGLKAVFLGIFLDLFAVPLIFLGKLTLLIVLGIIFWGIGLASQESIIRAYIAELVPAERRAEGYGLFSAVFGISWFVGSLFMGLLYEVSPGSLVVLSLVLHAISLLLLSGNAPLVRLTD